MLISGGDWDGAGYDYDFPTPMIESVTRGIDSPVTALDLSRNGTMVAFAKTENNCSDRNRKSHIILFQIGKYEEPYADIIIVGVENQKVTRLVFSHDGKTIAIGLRTGTIYLIDVQTKIATRFKTGNGLPINNLLFSPDGTYLFYSNPDGTSVVATPIDTAKKMKHFTGIKNGVKSISVSPQGKHLIAINFRGTIYGWTIETTVRRWSTSGLGNPISIHFTNENDFLYITDEAIISLCSGDMRSPTETKRTVLFPDIDSVVVSNAHGSLYVLGSSSVLRLWDRSKDKIVTELSNFHVTERLLAMSADGRILVCNGKRLDDSDSSISILDFGEAFPGIDHPLDEAFV